MLRKPDLTTLGLLGALFFTSISLACDGQNASFDSLIYEGEGIKITTQAKDCHDDKNGTHRQYLIISIENSTAAAKTISFEKELWYYGECLTCGNSSGEYAVKLDVAANSVLEGSCEENGPLRVFVKMLDLKGVRQLTHFELKQLNVNDAQR